MYCKWRVWALTPTASLTYKLSASMNIRDSCWTFWVQFIGTRSWRYKVPKQCNYNMFNGYVAWLLWKNGNTKWISRRWTHMQVLGCIFSIYPYEGISFVSIWFDDHSYVSINCFLDDPLHTWITGCDYWFVRSFNWIDFDLAESSLICPGILFMDS